MCAAKAATSVIVANANNRGTTNPQITSTGKVKPHAMPMISEAELAGRNSGLPTAKSSLAVLDMSDIDLYSMFSRLNRLECLICFFCFS